MCCDGTLGSAHQQSVGRWAPPAQVAQAHKNVERAIVVVLHTVGIHHAKSQTWCLTESFMFHCWAWCSCLFFSSGDLRQYCCSIAVFNIQISYSNFPRWIIGLAFDQRCGENANNVRSKGPPVGTLDVFVQSLDRQIYRL